MMGSGPKFKASRADFAFLTGTALRWACGYHSEAQPFLTFYFGPDPRQGRWVLIIDSSAILAIFFRETAAEELLSAILGADFLA